MKTIRIYGPGCANCRKVHQIVLKAVADLGVNVTVEKVEDVDRLIQAGIMRTPALGFDDEIVLQGKIPTEATVKNWIKERMEK